MLNLRKVNNHLLDLYLHHRPALPNHQALSRTFRRSPTILECFGVCRFDAWTASSNVMGSSFCEDPHILGPLTLICRLRPCLSPLSWMEALCWDRRSLRPRRRDRGPGDISRACYHCGTSLGHGEWKMTCPSKGSRLYFDQRDQDMLVNRTAWQTWPPWIRCSLTVPTESKVRLQGWPEWMHSSTASYRTHVRSNLVESGHTTSPIGRRTAPSRAPSQSPCRTSSHPQIHAAVNT